MVFFMAHTVMGQLDDQISEVDYSEETLPPWRPFVTALVWKCARWGAWKVLEEESYGGGHDIPLSKKAAEFWAAAGFRAFLQLGATGRCVHVHGHRGLQPRQTFGPPSTDVPRQIWFSFPFLSHF